MPNRSSSAPRYVGPAAPVDGAGAATPAPPAAPSADHGRRWREDGAFSTPVELTAGQAGRSRSPPRARRARPGAHPERVRHVQGRQPRRERQGRPSLDQGLGGRQDRRPGRRWPARSSASGKTLTFTGKESIEVRTGSSGVTYFTLNGTSLGALGQSGMPETWLFAPPAHRRRPSAADERARRPTTSRLRPRDAGSADCLSARGLHDRDRRVVHRRARRPRA